MRLLPQFPQAVPNLATAEDGNSLRERNRLAAKKWRKRKDEHLYELESENDSLRQRCFQLCTAARELRVENTILEEELGFFQDFMRKIMNQPK
jgi:hypothetical protein